MHRIAGWWDGFELWVAGLPFVPQFAVVLVGMVPISFLIAYLLDGGLREALRMLGRDRAAQPAPAAAGAVDSADAAGPGSDSPAHRRHPLEFGPQPLEYGPPAPVEYGPQPLEYGPQPLSGTPGPRQKEAV